MLALLFLLSSTALSAGPALKDRARDDFRHSDPEKAYTVARAYRFGDGVPRDAERAALWYERAAKLGHAGAGAELGLTLFQSGRRMEALSWLRRAASAGDARAQYTLATALYGAGDQASESEALKWMQRAAAKKLDAAIQALEIMRAPPAITRAEAVQQVAATRSIQPPAAWRVQIGAFSSRARAEAHWRSLSAALPQLSVSYESAGPLIRVRAGPVAGAAAAHLACARLRERGAACFPIKPESDGTA